MLIKPYDVNKSICCTYIHRALSASAIYIKSIIYSYYIVSVAKNFLKFNKMTLYNAIVLLYCVFI